MTRIASASAALLIAELLNFSRAESARSSREFLRRSRAASTGFGILRNSGGTSSGGGVGIGSREELVGIFPN